MPRVKIDYIVSFSNEDPEHQASNLLAWEVSKKKWLCGKGESSCSVVLQLEKAVKICAVHIGAHHAALVEVLVGRSEKPNDQFQVLVPSSVFLSPMESRRGEAAERVRSFSAEQLAADARDSRWDRVRIVCSQPYNKHCMYGLSFIHIHEPESKDSAPVNPKPVAEPAPTPTVPTTAPDRLLNLETYSSDDDEFRPGELFAKHQQRLSDSGGSQSTDAQIRQATSQALKNIPDSSTKLTKTPIAKTTAKRQYPTGDHDTNRQSARQRNSLMYTDDDEQPHAKIDRVVNKHNDERAKKADEEKEKRRKNEEKEKINRQKEKDQKKDATRHRNDNSNSQAKDVPKTPRMNKRNRSPPSSQSKKIDNRKRPHEDKRAKKGGLRAGPVSSSPHTLLKGVVFVLSGYENPRRAAVRDAALAMGARYERDWGPRCTHLVCAFPNTPKLKTVRASPNGTTAVVVTAEWVERCCERRRLLPWQWFATEPARRLAETPESDDDSQSPQRAGSESSTDDEAEKAQQKRKRQRTESPPPRRRDDSDSERHKQSKRSESPHPGPLANLSSESDVTFVRDERIKASVTIADSDSDCTEADSAVETCEVDEEKVLPDFFEGFTFAIDDGVKEVFDGELVRRYVQAYGGVVVDTSQLDEDSTVDYWLCAHAGANTGAGAQAVRADWVWRCHESRRLYPVAEYVL